MASFSAELRVAGHVFPVLHCRYGVHQATHQRGRVSTQVRHEPVHLTLAVPDGDALPAWAADAQQRLAAAVVFRAANAGFPLETLALGAAYCVSYQEEFAAGNAGNGAYVCHLVLSDPDGFTIQAGGPAAAFVAPAAQEHGAPQVAAGAGAGAATEHITRPLLKNGADPIYDLFGPGRQSHPNEWESTLARLKEEGVEIIHRAGAMAYGPSPASGKPGQLLLDHNASIGALRHETRHYSDDKRLGFPGAIRYYQEPDLRWQTEYNAYMEEVRIARQVRRFDTGAELVQNARTEKNYLIDNFNLEA